MTSRCGPEQRVDSGSLQVTRGLQQCGACRWLVLLLKHDETFVLKTAWTPRPGPKTVLQAVTIFDEAVYWTPLSSGLIGAVGHVFIGSQTLDWPAALSHETGAFGPEWDRGLWPRFPVYIWALRCAEWSLQTLHMLLTAEQAYRNIKWPKLNQISHTAWCITKNTISC